MIDHLAWAENYRDRAVKCEAASKKTSSKDFANCYQQLSNLYRNCAKLEEDFFEGIRKAAREEAEIARKEAFPSNNYSNSIQVTVPSSVSSKVG